jgi:hypothetical protein
MPTSGNKPRWELASYKMTGFSLSAVSYMELV